VAIQRTSAQTISRKVYPSTRVIIDATEIFVEQPQLPELKKMTFSSYKPQHFQSTSWYFTDGAITLVSSLYPGCISDKELTRKSGIPDLLKEGTQLWLIEASKWKKI